MKMPSIWKAMKATGASSATQCQCASVMPARSACDVSVAMISGPPAHARMLIIATLTSQADLAAITLAHWHWVALLAPVAFMAFQMDGIFIGATRSREMRNAMILAFAGFLLAVLVAGGYGLNGLLAAFTIYLGLRGITLMMRMRHVRAMAMPDDNTARNDTT